MWPPSLHSTCLLVGTFVPDIVRHARALLLKGDDLGYRPVTVLDGMHPYGLHVVLRVAVPVVPRGIDGDPLRGGLHGSEELLGELPLDA